MLPACCCTVCPATHCVRNQALLRLSVRWVSYFVCCVLCWIRGIYTKKIRDGHHVCRMRLCFLGADTSVLAQLAEETDDCPAEIGLASESQFSMRRA